MKTKPNKKCFCKYCDDCNWWRQREMEALKDGKPSGIKEIKWVCEWETLLNAMHYHMGSLDGLQEAVNESRNRSMETREAVDSFATACLKSFRLLAVKVPRLLGKQ